MPIRGRVATKVLHYNGTKIAVLAGWNSYNFDWNYLYNRAVNLFGEKGARNLIYAASPTREITNISWVEKDGTKHRAPAPSHSIIVDYMELCQNMTTHLHMRATH